MYTKPPSIDDAAQASANAAMVDETDADLLQYISWRAEHPSEAEEAFVIFHGRHAGFLFGYCKRQLRGTLPTYYSVEDLVGDTFTRILERASTFDAGGEKNRDCLCHLVRAWMLRIARNILADVHRGHPTLETTMDPELLEDLAADEPPVDSPRTRLAQRAFVEVLDDRQREVILATLHWWKAGDEHQRLPNDVAADLARRFSTTTDNLRKIRASALRKIRAYIVQAETDRSARK